MTTIKILHYLLLICLFFSPALCRVNITHLPGFDGPLPFRLETGYETVGGDIELFYYFFPSERNPSKDPLILWSTGGPGCSALNGLIIEIGPIRILLTEYDGSLPKLVHHPFSWTKVANIIFLDSPVGTGFSFSKYPLKAGEVNDISASTNICEFLKKWYNHHPEFMSNPLYIGGDSYAGKIVPLVAYHMATAEGIPLFSNLKGYMVGNPTADPNFDLQYRVPFAHGMGIISDELFKEINENCEGELYQDPNPSNIPCVNSLNQYSMITSEVYSYYILGAKCWESPAALAGVKNKRSLREDGSSELFYPPGVPDIKCRDDYAKYLQYHWANNKLTREALHVKKGTVKEWMRCKGELLPYTYNVPSALKYHHYLIQRGYRALVYSGDHDLTIPFLGTQAWVRSLNFSVVENWRSWNVDGQVAGYTQKYKNDLTFATVKNGGHTAPTNQPENCFAMFDRWISENPL